MKKNKFEYYEKTINCPHCGKVIKMGLHKSERLNCYGAKLGPKMQRKKDDDPGKPKH